MKVLVINAYPERRDKYDENYEMFPARLWNTITEDELSEFTFRHNCNMELRKKITACCLSHLEVLKKIVDEDLKDVVILEDDCYIEDMEGLRSTIKYLPNEFLYLGGEINATLLKNYPKFRETEKPDIIKMIDRRNQLYHQIMPDKFRITMACSYYIPNKEVAGMILHEIMKHFSNKKLHAIDHIYWQLQKKKVIKGFIFPALCVLHEEDAKTGFTFSQYKLHDNHKFY